MSAGQTIYLIGFMGAGKTSVGKVLAKKLKIPFYDQDHIITERTGMSPSEIFAKEGEPHFRELEASILRETLFDVPHVYSTGGGCPCYHGNMEYMKEKGQTVYLKTSPKILTSRLSEEKSNRPLLQHKSKDELYTYIDGLLAEREPFYSLSALVIESDKLESREKIADRIIALLAYSLK